MDDVFDAVLKCTQTCFYIVAGTLAVLTYRSARNGLLNAVNTEYQKRVMDRLAKLAEELVTEFDPTSERYWARRSGPEESVIAKQIAKVNEGFLQHGKGIIREGRYTGGYLGHDFDIHSRVALMKADPFIPRKIRQEIVAFIEDRDGAANAALFKAIDGYAQSLVAKEFEPKNEHWHWVHNEVQTSLRAQGFGISQVEDRVNQFRLDIQAHMESFDPLRAKPRVSWLERLIRRKGGLRPQVDR